MIKNIKLSDLLYFGRLSLKDEDENQAENLKQFKQLMNKIEIKTFIPLVEKQTVLLNMTEDLSDEFGDESTAFSCGAELSFIINAIDKYTNIIIDIDYMKYSVYDSLYETGIVDYISSVCQKDWDRLERMYRQMISFDNLQRLIEGLNGLKVEEFEKAVSNFKDFVSTTDKDLMETFVDITKREDPQIKQLYKLVSAEAVKKVLEESKTKRE